VSSPLVESAPAKINLTLRVIGRREDGYHELESLVGFAGAADRLGLAPAGKLELEINGPFAAACGPVEHNLVLKAARALGERIAGLKNGRFHLEKILPVAAGIGGGSADAAAALRLLARANDIAPDDARLASAARATGADVPVCLDPRARVMRGVGDVLSEPVVMPRLDAVLVNPGVPLSTREVFARFDGGPGSGRTAPGLGRVPHQLDAMISFLGEHGNDLTEAAMACAREVAQVLRALRALRGVRLARMSGSGPTCFALFASAGEASAAARLLADTNRDWWVCPTTVG
jgi:4-diphosphocytidyl-2-C-methyl-D-erythritol kinase